MSGWSDFLGTSNRAMFIRMSVAFYMVSGDSAQTALANAVADWEEIERSIQEECARIRSYRVYSELDVYQ